MKCRTVGMATGLVVGWIAASVGANEQERIAALERQMAEAHAEIASLKGEKSDLSFTEQQAEKLHLGGYGEIHANFESGGDDVFDIHRLVMYVGYDFADWIKLTSETELEHAYVTDGAGGEISIEQLYVDFLFADAANLRAGRVLAPLGIINQLHEPTLFQGVERPSVDRVIIPTTWSLDGIGVFGHPLGWLSYELYGVAGLDGSGFSAASGVRGGRIKERQDLNDPAVTGRIDLHPVVSARQNLRLGLSGYHGGTDNANDGGGNGIDNTFSMYSGDFDYTLSRLLLRGVVAHGFNSDAEDLAAGVGEEIFGWYLEAGVRVLPERWKTGKLAEADLIPFVRYEEYDTQYKVPAGTVKNGNNDRTDFTLGVNVPLTGEFVVKADCQLRFDEAGDEPNTLFNLGMGWVFQ